MKKRILHVVPDLMPYGLERVVWSLVTRADRDEYEPGVVSMYDAEPGSMGPELERRGVKVFHLGKRRGFDPRTFGSMASVLRDWRPNLLHTHNYVLRYVLPAAAAAGMPPIVHTIHNVADREVERVGQWLHQLAFRRWVRPVAIADEVAASFQRVYKLDHPALIPNGIDLTPYAAARQDRGAWRQREGFTEDELLLVCVARFYEQKNHKTLLDAFAQLKDELPKARLLLAGDGHLRGAVEQQIAALGLGSRVTLLGRRDDVAGILGASDIFVLPSLWEGNPLSVMEAMAAGLPVAVTAVGGVPELVETGRSGLLCNPGDVDSLASALRTLAGSAALRRGFGEQAMARAEARFGEQAMVRAYEQLYAEELAGRTSNVRRAA
ncbi:glycosyltransferase [Paludibaculum fermentans]|uniref:Glycosyltransferase n=1 Tax=Paludibaculum fermentans TaxID=1473598 RepID=A0A7S7NW66_PALFE|nr:glycosyltransferase [Paludibaculum fermentans]QOY90870.1 glycosyltransferase [Paludibaculum fermentans]